MSCATLRETLDNGGIWSIARGLAREEQTYKQHDALLFCGELPRGDVPELLGTSERTARRVVSSLIDYGVVTAKTTKGALQISFPARVASRWMPGLFPDQ